MLAQAIVAIKEPIDRLHLPVRLVWSWSDCLSAVQSLCSATLTMRPGHIFDRVVAAGNVAGVLQRWGWFPAQHDSNLKDWLSKVNAEMDANAKWAVDGHARSAVVLSVWLEGSSVLPFQGEKVIVHLKKFVQEADLLGYLGIQNGATPACREWLSVFPESTTGARHWLQVQPLRLELWGLARCWSLYSATHEWFWDHAGGQCPLCRQWVPYVSLHQLHDCLYTKLNILRSLEDTRKLLEDAGVSSNRVEVLWGRITIHGAVPVHIVWMHPDQAGRLPSPDSPGPVHRPVWISSMPFRGISGCLLRHGVQLPQALQMQVLAAASQVLQSDSESDLPSVPAAEPRLVLNLLHSINSNVLVGFSGHISSHRQSYSTRLLWVLVSALREHAGSHLSHFLVDPVGVAVGYWSPRCPDVCLVESHGDLAEMMEVAQSRRLRQQRVYWCILSPKWPRSGVRQDIGINLWHFHTLKGNSVGFLVSDYHMSLGAHPEVVFSLLVQLNL